MGTHFKCYNCKRFPKICPLSVLHGFDLSLFFSWGDSGVLSLPSSCLACVTSVNYSKKYDSSGCSKLAHGTVVPRELSPHPLAMCSLALVPFSSSPKRPPVSWLIPRKHCASIFLHCQCDDVFLLFTCMSLCLQCFPALSASVQGMVKCYYTF